MTSSIQTPKIMVFQPTWEEFRNFSNYIIFMESQGAHKAGIAKIIPPTEWRPREKNYEESDIMNLKIPRPISQIIKGELGVYKHCSKVRKSMKVSEFKEMAECMNYRAPYHSDDDDLEKKYWESISNVPKNKIPLYGADVAGSITDENVDVWNINKLGTILDTVKDIHGVIIEGVNTAYLYFGMWRTSFAWHTEDMDLYSINYVHDGHPKTWYAISPDHGGLFEKFAASVFKTDAQMCSAFLRHKMAVISPDVLRNSSIPFDRITQRKGEIVITFPYGYHAGFNHGFNIAESTNFASENWLEYGRKATICHCWPNTVEINMSMFDEFAIIEKSSQTNCVQSNSKNVSHESATNVTRVQDILCNQKIADIPKSETDNEKKCHCDTQILEKELPAISPEYLTHLESLDIIEMTDEERQLMDQIWSYRFYNARPLS